MIFEKLSAIADAAPATSGLRQGDEFISYADIAARIERLAAGFIDRGIGPGEVVALLVPNSPEIFTIAHALFAIGAIAMPLAPGATRAELAALVAKTGLAAVVATPKSIASAELLIADVAPAAQLFLTTALPDAAPGDLPKLAGNTTALYLSSSGSTGLPKIVPHTHAEILADGQRTSTAWDLQPDDVMVNILPPNFAMGFLMGVIDVVSRAATTFYWSDALPLALSRRKLLDALVRERVTLMGAVPAMYEIIAAQPGDLDLRLRMAFSGGAALRRPVFDAASRRLGLPLRQAYGSTEAIMVSHNDADDVDATWTSVGRPAGDAEVRIAPFDTELGPGVGELMVRSSSLMQGLSWRGRRQCAGFGARLVPHRGPGIAR